MTKAKDIAGMRFCKLVAIKPTDKRSSKCVVWECLCDCGESIDVSISHLSTGHTRSCGCLRQIDLVGKRFGSLLVKRFVGRGKNRAFIWECICDCGNTRNARGDYLNRGYTKSCGCNTSFYNSWHCMMTRCYNPNYTGFHRYGGRGIKVCEEWHSVINFYRDMRDPPDNYTLGRIDNDKDYGPDNCRWETKEQQNNNTSTNRFLTYNGETKTYSQWAKSYNLKSTVFHGRLKLGWPVEKALLTPVRKLGRKKCDEDFRGVDLPQPQPFTKEICDDAIAMIEKSELTLEKGN